MNARIRDQLTSRAMSAYFRTGGSDQPNITLSGKRQHEGRTYVVLNNVSGLLAAYRLRNDGVLKRLKRVPAGLNDSETTKNE